MSRDRLVRSIMLLEDVDAPAAGRVVGPRSNPRWRGTANDRAKR